MIDKVFINKKLENFFRMTETDSILKVFLISFLYDKINYIEKIVGNEVSLIMLNKYIYNLENNLKSLKKIKKYHSIYTNYSFEDKCLKYYMTKDYKKFNKKFLSKNQKKDFIIKEFKIMMYNELDKIINIYSLNGKIISNGFYIEDEEGRYPEYNGNFSDIMDIFSDCEACEITNLTDRVKTYIDKDKNYYIYSKHISKRNSQVMNYIEFLKKVIDVKQFYFSVNNPKRYTKEMINNFNVEYKYILNSGYDFLLKDKRVFSLIENYLLHIRNKIDFENNLRYHQDLSTIFKMINNKKNIDNFSKYVLQSNNGVLDFQEV